MQAICEVRLGDDHYGLVLFLCPRLGLILYNFVKTVALSFVNFELLWSRV